VIENVMNLYIFEELIFQLPFFCYLLALSFLLRIRFRQLNHICLSSWHQLHSREVC